MSEMIERVAKAIEAERTKIIMAGSWRAEEECRRFAEAAIRAMRKPTDAMVDACGNGEAAKWAPGVWELYIDAALSSPPSKS